MTMAWRDYLGKDAGWKLFSLLMAILIWASIRAGLEDDVALRKVVVNPLKAAQSEADRMSEPFLRPVSALRLPSDQHRYRVTPPLVQVVVRAGPAILRTLDEADVQVFIDVADFESNPGVVAGKVPCAIQVRVPPGVSFVRSEPSAVVVERLSQQANGAQPDPKP